MSLPFKILIAPLDWGLGHATRCLPIIGLLLNEGHSVTLAAPEPTIAFVKEHFPEINTVVLHGYGITYAKKGFYFSARIISQIPKILKAIRREQTWLQQIQASKNFDLIISDNRYGLHHAGTRCAIMTHQLEIQTGLGQMANRLLQKWHYRLLEKFDACWVVDNPDNKGIGGKLSHPENLPQNACYIGLLSQFSLSNPKAETNTQTTSEQQKKEILILLSGPEPMRGLLEKELKNQCGQLSSKYVIHFVAGKLGTKAKPERENGFHYYPCLNGKELAPLLSRADLIVSRSGYSTLMDLAFFEKRAVLIPTPGQTEQEYLAKFLHQKWGVAITRQGNISLQESIPAGLSVTPIQGFDNKKYTLLRKAIDRLRDGTV